MWTWVDFLFLFFILYVADIMYKYILQCFGIRGIFWVAFVGLFIEYFNKCFICWILLRKKKILFFMRTTKINICMFVECGQWAVVQIAPPFLVRVRWRVRSWIQESRCVCNLLIKKEKKMCALNVCRHVFISLFALESPQTLCKLLSKEKSENYDDSWYPVFLLTIY